MLQVLQYFHKHKARYETIMHIYNTRNLHSFLIPKNRLNASQRSLNYFGSKLYNILPPHIKTLTNSVEKFKKYARIYIVENNNFLENLIMKQLA